MESAASSSGRPGHETASTRWKLRNKKLEKSTPPICPPSSSRQEEVDSDESEAAEADELFSGASSRSGTVGSAGQTVGPQETLEHCQLHLALALSEKETILEALEKRCKSESELRHKLDRLEAQCAQLTGMAHDSPTAHYRELLQQLQTLRGK